ncbi:MAG: TFIIB-type zinc ribbon-containing protein [Clostridiales bacterium]|nr:TFIIB-type zinc ribbon-containing protein [Clostridiales bacterium]
MAIWDESKKDQARFDTTAPASFSADSKKCANCGSNLFFDTDHAALMCGNCGSVFDPETLDRTGSFALTNPEKDYDNETEMSEDDKRRHEIVCNSCGAQIVTDENTSSTFCAFCGSPAIVTRRLTREFKPDYIIPFAFGKEKAISIFKTHCEDIAHLPKNYINDEVLSKLTGIYVPTWIISTEVEARLCGIARVGKVTDHMYEYSGTGATSADNYSQRIYAKAKFRLKDIPFDGEKKLPDRLMSAAEPFDFTDLVPFRPEYLQGYFAEKYDEQPLDMTDKIYRRLDKYALEVSDTLDLGYDKFTPDYSASRTRYKNQVIKYALLPIWFLTLEYKGIKYQYIVNGQTGKVSGEFPYSKGWETVNRSKNRAKMKTITANEALRGFLYALPWLLFCFGLPFLFYYQTVNYLLENPLTGLAILVLIALLIVFLTKYLPRILLGAEKKGMDKLNEDDSHKLAKELNYLQYFDPSFATEAYETTFDFAPLDSGWNYAAKNEFDFITARPEAEKEEEAEGTEFEKQGFDRKIFE